MTLILTWKKTIPLRAGVTFDIVPMQQATSDQAMFVQVFKAVVADKTIDYTLTERTDKIVQCRRVDDSLGGYVHDFAVTG